MGEEGKTARTGGRKKNLRKARIARIYHLHHSESVNLQKAQAYLDSLSSPEAKVERMLDEMEKERRKWKE